MKKNPKRGFIYSDDKFYHQECFFESKPKTPIVKQWTDERLAPNKICFWCGRRLQDFSDRELKSKPKDMSQFDISSYSIFDPNLQAEELRKRMAKPYAHGTLGKRKNPGFGMRLGKALDDMGKIIRKKPKKKKKVAKKKSAKKKIKRKNPFPSAIE